MMGNSTFSPAIVGPSPKKVTFRRQIQGISMPELRIFEDISYTGRLTWELRPGIIFDLGVRHSLEKHY